jgi:hypothetical protein
VPGTETASVTGKIVRDVIAEIAPAELPIVDGLCQLSPRMLRRRLRRRRRERDPVGFGLDQVTTLMTPVAWIVVDELVRRVTDDTADSYGHRIVRVLRAAIRRLTRRPATAPVAEPSSSAAPPALTVQQLAAVRRQIAELAPRHGLTTEEAEILGDRVVAKLVLHTGAVADKAVEAAAVGAANAPLEAVAAADPPAPGNAGRDFPDGDASGHETGSTVGLD